MKKERTVAVVSAARGCTPLSPTTLYSQKNDQIMPKKEVDFLS